MNRRLLSQSPLVCLTLFASGFVCLYGEPETDEGERIKPAILEDQIVEAEPVSVSTDSVDEDAPPTSTEPSNSVEEVEPEKPLNQAPTEMPDSEETSPSVEEPSDSVATTTESEPTSDGDQVQAQKDFLLAAISNTSASDQDTTTEGEDPIVEEPVAEVSANMEEVPAPEMESTPAPTSYAMPARSSWRSRYELGPGDELNFGLHGKPTLKKLAVAVAPDGTISYLQAKQIDVRGKTIDELRHQLNGVLADYHRDARVIITPSKLGSKQYTVLGEVRKNGTYSLDRPITLLQALAAAGGFNLGKSGEGAVQLADLRRSFVVRDGNRMPVDMESLYLAGDMTQNVHVEPGDYIYVASKLRNEVYVFGSVNTPGVKAIESRMTTLGAIAAAEGFSPQAWRDRVLIIRGKMDDPETIVMPLNKVLHGKSHDIEILPGDIVYVHNRPWAYAARVLDAAILAYIDGSFAGWLADDGNIAVTSGS